MIFEDDEFNGNSPLIFSCKVDNITVFIYEEEVDYPTLGKRNTYAFMQVFPIDKLDEEGGMITVSNLFKGIHKRKWYDTNEELNHGMRLVNRFILKNNPTMRLVYKGIILKDDMSYAKPR